MNVKVLKGKNVFIIVYETFLMNNLDLSEKCRIFAEN